MTGPDVGYEWQPFDPPIVFRGGGQEDEEDSANDFEVELCRVVAETLSTWTVS
jgi:hypothetical protein